MLELCHALASYAAGAHPHPPVTGFGGLEDALLDEALLAEGLGAEVLPLVLLFLPSLVDPGMALKKRYMTDQRKKEYLKHKSILL